MFLFDEEQSYIPDMSKIYNPKIQKVSIIIKGKPSQLYAQGMRSFEQYNEICKYFAEGKQRDAKANEVQKQLKLHDLSVREYSDNKYALWLDFRMINGSILHGMCRRIENHRMESRCKLKNHQNWLECLTLTYT